MSTCKFYAIAKDTTRSTKCLLVSTVALALMTIAAPAAPAQDAHSDSAIMHRDQAPGRAGTQSPLIKAVRDATERFKDVAVAEAEGYVLQFGCVTGPDAGAMGLHYVNGALVNAGAIDAAHPQIVIYEPTPGGGRRLIGADYLVLAGPWDAKHSGPPQLMGQRYHLFASPNRFGLPAFYTLHVWAWKSNPSGSFVNWHPNVSCEAFDGGQNQ